MSAPCRFFSTPKGCANKACAFLHADPSSQPQAAKPFSQSQAAKPFSQSQAPKPFSQSQTPKPKALCKWGAECRSRDKCPFVHPNTSSPMSVSPSSTVSPLTNEPARLRSKEMGKVGKALSAIGYKAMCMMDEMNCLRELAEDAMIRANSMQEDLKELLSCIYDLETSKEVGVIDSADRDNVFDAALMHGADAAQPEDEQFEDCC